MIALLADGILGALQTQITAPDAEILHRSLAFGQTIFGTFFVTSVVIMLCRASLQQDSFASFFWSLGAMIFKMIIPLGMLQGSQAVLPLIQDIASYASTQITGQPAVAGGGADALAGLGVFTATSLIHAAGAPLSTPAGLADLVVNPGNAPLALFNLALASVAGVLILICFAWVALAVVLAWYQTLFATAVGACMSGFFATEATSNMAWTFTSGVVSGIAKVVFMTVWPVMVAQVFTNYHFATDAAHPKDFLGTCLSLITFSIIVLIMTFRIERIADTMFSGQASWTVADIARTASTAVQGGARVVRAAVRA